MGVLKVLDGTDWRKIGCDEPLTFTDAYNRAGPALGSPYVFYNGGTFAIDTNEVKWSGTNTGFFPLALIDRGSERIDMSIDLTVAGAGSSRSGALVWNVVDANTFFLLAFSYWEIAFYKVVAGSVSLIWNTSSVSNPSPEATYSVQHDANTLTLSKAGAPFLFYSDLSLFPGLLLTPGGTKHGIGIDNTDTRLDNLLIVGADPGRLRMWSGSEWLVECCPGEVGHPLKIEDPDSPGDWIQVACMRSPGGLFDTAAFDSATYG